MHSSVPRRASLVAALAVAVPSAASSQEDTLVRFYDVRAYEAAGIELPHGVDLRLPLVSSFIDRMEPDRWDLEVESGFDPDEYGWSQILLDGLGEDWPDERMYADRRGGFLRVEGTRATHDAVAAILGELGEHVLDGFDVEVRVLDPASLLDGTPAVLTAAEIDALLTSARVVDYVRGVARAGHRAHLGGESVRSSVVDYDVEVASKARVPDPTVIAIRHGLHVGVLARRRAGGGILLRAWGRRGVLAGETRRFPLAHFDGAPIELSEMASTLAVASAGVEDGGGILLRHDGGAEGAWLVRVRSRDATGSGASSFVALGELTARPLAIEPPWLPRAAPSGGWDEDVAHWAREELGDALETPLHRPEDVFDLLRDERDELGLGGRLLLVGHALWARGSDELAAHCRRRVSELAEPLAPAAVEVEVRYGLVARAEGVALASAAPSAAAGRLASRIVGVARPGDTLLFVDGRERHYVQDHDVEIAEAAAILDPIPGDRFEGVSLWCLPVGAGSGGHAAWLELAVQAEDGPVRTAGVPVWEPRNPEHGDPDRVPTGTFHARTELELIATARAATRTMVRAEDGAWTLVACQGVGGTDRMLVAVARLTRR